MATFRLLYLTTRYQSIAALLAGLACAVFWPAALLSFAVGAAFGIANFWTLRTLAQKALAGGKAKGAYAAMLALKMVAALTVMGLLLVFLRLNVIAVAAGMALLFVGLLGAFMHEFLFSDSAPTAS